MMRVVISYAVGGSTSVAVNAVLRNALKYTDSPIVVHVSQGSPTWSVDYNRTVSHKRMHVNPTHLLVVKHTPSILLAHISNWRFCEGRIHLCNDIHGRFVLMSANSVLFRPGLERFAASHSHAAQGGCTVSGANSRPGMTADSVWDKALKVVQWDEEISAHDASRQPHVNHHGNLSAHDRSVLARWGRPVWNLLASRTPPGWSASPISMGRHEGTFYAFGTMRKFVRAFDGSIFAQAAQLQQDRAKCDCYCFLYNGTACAINPWTGNTKFAVEHGCLGGCTFEELLLPSFAAQQSTTEAWKHAPPPAILHVSDISLADWHADRNTTMLLHELTHKIAASSQLQHVFGVKVPRHSFIQVERMLLKTY